MINLPASQDVAYFIEIASALNISRAAERLGIAQPTLTVALQRLERDIGVKLVLRDKTGVRLTAAGVDFNKGAKELLSKWSELRADTLNKNKIPAGRYRLGAHSSVALFSWTKILRQVCADFPKIDFEFSHDHSRLITDQVIQSEIDFAVAVNPVHHPDLVIKKIGDDQVELWVASKKSYNASTIICDPAMLQVQSILSCPGSRSFTRRIHTSNLEVVADLADQGVGVAVLPGRVVKQGLRFNLKPLGGNSPTFHDKIYFIYRKDRHSTPASQILIESIFSNLVEVFSEH